MTPTFFRRARRPEGATLLVGSQPVVVRVLPEVFLDGRPVTATFDEDTATIEIKAQPIAMMRDSLFHELFHAAIRVFRLHDRFRGRSEKSRTAAEEDISHVALPVILGAMDQCKTRGTPPTFEGTGRPRGGAVKRRRSIAKRVRAAHRRGYVEATEKAIHLIDVAITAVQRETGTPNTRTMLGLELARAMLCRWVR